LLLSFYFSNFFFKLFLASVHLIISLYIGTLRKFLSRHPQLAVCKNELHFFNRLENFQKGYGWYIDKMPTSSYNQITIEKSSKYYVSPVAAEEIQKMNELIKLILIVRDPTIRLMSNYVHLVDWGKEVLNFTEAVFENYCKVNILYDPVQLGMYAKHLRVWYTLFPKDNIHIVDGYKFAHNNPAEELRKIELFLHLKPFFKREHFMFDEHKGFFCLNVSGMPECMPKGKGRQHPYVSPDQLQCIRQFYKPYNEDFFKLTGIHFDWNQI
jgi:hypothetical protein